MNKKQSIFYFIINYKHRTYLLKRVAACSDVPVCSLPVMLFYVIHHDALVEVTVHWFKRV